MNLKFTYSILFLIFLNSTVNAQEIINIKENFDKIIVSPHIEVKFKKGTKASILIDDINVDREKFLYEIEKGTLQVYLEGAKTYTKNKKIVQNGYDRKIPLYKNRVVQLTITYTDVSIFSLRGEEKISFLSPLVQEECKLRIYGKSEVYVKEINVDQLKVSIYGDSFLSMDKGSINKQKITSYGASKIMAADVETIDTKITTYGDGVYQLNAKDRIKVTCYGEATVLYKGDAQIKKGIVIGESKIKKIS